MSAGRRRPGEVGDQGVRRARVAAQLLHRPGRRPDVADVVSRLLALQAQDIGAAPLAIRARSRGLTAADVASARDGRAVVRGWGPRGTLHLMAAEDLDWLVPLVVPPGVNNAMRRLRQEGVAGSAEELVRACTRALAGRGPLTKAEVAERLATLGRRAHGQGIVHVLFLAAAHGTVVLGPDRANRPTYVHAADWLGREPGRKLDRDRAAAELARRYLRAHAPAEPEDLAAWSGLPVRDARAAWRAIADELSEVSHGDRPLWRLKRGSPRPAEVPLALLPAFDEYLLGWRDRALVLPEAHARKVLPGGGMIGPAVLADGRVIGTWRPGRGRDVAATLFEPVDGGALEVEYEDVARFAAG